MAVVRRVMKPQRILDFDIENRPLTYLGMDFTTAEITAIAAGWTDEKKVGVKLLGVDDPEDILTWFVDLYNKADIVTGHYIRKHDLPIINGALMEMKLPLLSPKLTSDTKMDLVRRGGISASQESLAGMYELPEPKEHMGQAHWRMANRLLPEGIEETRRRAVGDIHQHKALRTALIEAGALRPPKMWRG